MGAISEEAKARRREYNRAYMAAKRAADPERYRRTVRETYARDPEKHKAKVRAYRAGLPSEVARRRARQFKLQSAYGISLAQFDEMRAAQNCRCAICGRHEDDIPKPRPGDYSSLVPDHCHDTGKNRGLLCNPCNLLIGHARNDEVVLARAVEYLRAHRGA